MPKAETDSLTPRTIEAAMQAVDKCGEQTIGLIMGFMLLVDAPGDEWWIGTKYDFVRPRVHPPTQFAKLANELIRPILEQPDTSAEQRIDQILCMIGVVCVLCGFNPPDDEVPTELRTALQRLLISE